MINVLEDTVLIVATLFIDRREILLNRVQSEFDRIFNLDQAVAIVILDNRFAHALFEESSVWENKLASFEFSWVWRKQVLHQPREILFFNLVIVGDVNVNGVWFSF